MSGGSGGGGTTNVAQFKPPDYTVQGWADYINNATAITQTPYQPYYGMQIAPINNTQVQGMQYMANLAGNNAPDYATARANNQLTAAGAFENPFSSIQTQNGVNPYMGFSPDYGAFKQQSMDDVVRAYQTGTAAQTDSAFNRAGAFHGGGHDAQIAANEYGLGKNLQNMSSNMDFQQWQNSAGLGENALNRGLQAQTGDLNRASQYWDTERQRQVGALPAAIAAQQADMQRAQGLIGVGDAQRQYQQDMLNQQYNNFNQWQQFPFQMLDAYGAALSRGSGNYGTNTAQSQQNYQANPLASLIGGGLLGAGLYSGWNSPG
jgi:hypothetical protein